MTAMLRMCGSANVLVQRNQPLDVRTRDLVASDQTRRRRQKLKNLLRIV